MTTDYTDPRPALRLDYCEACGSTTHPAYYSHEGQWNQGAIYVVVCGDGLTDYYRAAVIVPA